MALKRADASKSKMDSTGSSSSKYVYEWLWGCCYCGGQAAMSVDSTLACPECGVYRCENCAYETVKRRAHPSIPAPSEVSTLKDNPVRTGSVAIEDPIQQQIEICQTNTRESSNAKGSNLASVTQQTDLDLSQLRVSQKLDTTGLVAPAEDLTTVAVKIAKSCSENESG